MKLARYLKPDQIALDLDDKIEARLGLDGIGGDAADVWAVKLEVLAVLTECVASTGRVGSVKKLLADLVNREKKASTALGRGLAVPHVRTKQAKRFLLAFARSTRGLPFGAPDGSPVHLFFCVCAPPYDDRFYLEVYRGIGRLFGFAEARRALMEARDAHEVLRVLATYQDYPAREQA